MGDTTRGEEEEEEEEEEAIHITTSLLDCGGESHQAARFTRAARATRAARVARASPAAIRAGMEDAIRYTRMARSGEQTEGAI
jgi:hypothetical protein